MKKLLGVITSTVAMLFLVVPPTFAHVVVGPNEVGVAQRVNFAVSVPTEESVPTTQVRLLIPESLTSVRPNVKPGWNIEIKKSGEGEDAKVTEIIWSGGSIPADQRDEFVFRAMAPANETELQWKAYQTYEGGKVVAWDQDPKAVEEYEKNNPVAEGEHDENAPNPFSVTKVINDLAASTGTTNESGSTTVASVSNADLAGKVNLLMLLSGGALILSIAAIYMQMKKK